MTWAAPVVEAEPFCYRAAVLDSTAVVAVAGIVVADVAVLADVGSVGIVESADYFDSTAEDKI